MQLLNLVAKNGHPTSICGQTMQLMHFIRSGGQRQILLTMKLLFYATNCVRVGPQLGCLNLSGCQKAVYCTRACCHGGLLLWFAGQRRRLWERSWMHFRKSLTWLTTHTVLTSGLCQLLLCSEDAAAVTPPIQ